MGVLTYDSSTIGLLECLHAYHERVQNCSKDAADKYAVLLNLGQLFTPADIVGIHGISDYKVSKLELKKCVVNWMIKYTDNAASALFVIKIAKETSTHIYKGLKEYIKMAPTPKNYKFNFPILLKKVLAHTRYNCLYDMLCPAKACTYLEDLKKGSKMDRKKVFNFNQPFANETHIGTVSIFHYPLIRPLQLSVHGEGAVNDKIKTKKRWAVADLPSKGSIPNVVVDVQAFVPEMKSASTLSEKSKVNDEIKMKKISAVADLPSEGSIPNVFVNVEAVVWETKSASTLSENQNSMMKSK
jgi:hypothetical protein